MLTMFWRIELTSMFSSLHDSTELDLTAKHFTGDDNLYNVGLQQRVLGLLKICTVAPEYGASGVEQSQPIRICKLFNHSYTNMSRPPYASFGKAISYYNRYTALSQYVQCATDRYIKLNSLHVCIYGDIPLVSVFLMIFQPFYMDLWKSHQLLQ